MKKYDVILTVPSVDDYLKIRKNTLGERSKENAEIALENSWAGVHVKCKDETIGMGRIIGDGGVTFHATDIAVMPEHQGKGVGKLIFEALVNYYKQNGPSDGYFTLIADGNAKHLYSKFGFKQNETAVGMVFEN